LNCLLPESVPPTPTVQTAPAGIGLLRGKVALITGGSKGLGRGLCQVFAREGATVLFNYSRDEAAATEVCQALGPTLSEGQGLQAYKVSVTDKHGIKHMVRDILARYGRIDILVNNAAINKADSFATTTEASWRDIVETNVNGLYYITKPIIKQMMRQRQGSILNISSIGGIRALPTSVHYATTKAAVIGFTKCLSREAAPFGINVNGIAAGIFETDLGHALPDHFKLTYAQWCAKGRFGRPEELAEFAAFLVSDRNTYMTGEVVTLDGGSVV
jgi:3-oxoacyl-[acyl-carrier protein] reductase